MAKRAIIIVLDGVGIGELADANEYGDCGSNTLMNIKRAMPKLELKNMCNLGLGLIDGDNLYTSKGIKPLGLYGKLSEKSKGKDTTIGHWEISGLHIDKPFPTYPNGFDKSIIETFEKAINTKTLGNIVASGTAIINELGYEHTKTGYPIIYTSADSVFQIAAHENIIPLAKLYEYCEIARSQLDVARVIARPFVGEKGNFKRTINRRDYSLDPIGKTMLDYIKESGLEVATVGKIEDIFNNKGITKSIHTHTNKEGIAATINYINEDFSGLIFTNLVDTDMLFGHRNDVKGFCNSLTEFDNSLPYIMNALKDDDILIITSDHGCDPTTSSTDHSREHALLLCYGKNIPSGNAGTRESFADIGKSVLKYLEIDNNIRASSFL